MRYSANILLMFVFTVSFVLADGKDDKHPLDQANEAFRKEQYSHAVDLCLQVLINEPSAQGYNTLALAREKLGQYEQAINSYSMALKLEPADKLIRHNYNRAVIRNYFRSYRPHALLIFLGSIGILCLIALANGLLCLWKKYKLRQKYRGVKVKRSDFIVRDNQDRLNPDCRAYFDTNELVLEVSVAVPQRVDIYPFNINLDIYSPAGQFYRQISYELTQDCIDHGSIKIAFCFENQLADILNNGGTWRLTATLEPTRQKLFMKKLEVVTKSMLLDNLIVSESALMVNYNGKTVVENKIPNDTQSIIPYIRIEVNDYLPTKYNDMNVQVQLCSSQSSESVSCASVPLNLTEGFQEICLEHPVANSLLAQQAGEWGFFIGVENKRLVQIPFTVIDCNQALQSLKLTRVTLAGIGTRDGVYPMGEIVYDRPKAVVPIFSLTTEHFSRLLSFPISLGICVDDEPVVEYVDTISLEKNDLDFIPGQYELPEWEDGRQEMIVTFVLFVGEKTIAMSSVTIRKRAPRCADAQGRLTNIREFPTDSCEADRILSEAKVCV